MLRTALAAFLVSAAPALAQGIAVDDAYAIAATPMATLGTAYMTIRNEGGDADRLLSAASPAADRVEHAPERDGRGRGDAHGSPSPRGSPSAGARSTSRAAGPPDVPGPDDRWEDGDLVPLTLTSSARARSRSRCRWISGVSPAATRPPIPMRPMGHDH
jgi:hypothetical protein